MILKKTQHRNLKTKQHEPNQKLGLISEGLKEDLD